MSDRRRSLQVLVTGAGTGLGQGLALRLADRGHAVIAGTLGSSEAEALVERRGSIAPIQLDVTDPADLDQLRGLDVDVLVNNAGVAQAGPMRAVPIERVRTVLETNVVGTLAVTQAVLPRMFERGSGRILIMSSVAGLVAGPFTGPYSMSKHALQAMGTVLRAELAPAGIDVALVNPGPFATGFNDRMIDDTLEWLPDALARPEERELRDAARDRITSRQADPELAVDVIVGLVEAERTELVNLIPPDVLERIRAAAGDHE